MIPRGLGSRHRINQWPERLGSQERRALVPEAKQEFTTEEARDLGVEVGIEWSTAPFDAEQFRIGLNVELEHGRHDPATNVTDDDPHITAKIALAHLNEFPDYYTRLERMEEEAKRDWEQLK
jgi:hypothetical protein